ncbi:MAG TPA: bifunctional phosphoribosylaminoimidazolecarboxamide formyltransferase/IMP cyclohydrolase [Thermoanaerobaculia bacterium]|nr:bifunctional phosphoribosylaminoimidazolecarboxamide formyltransferase/IMP cyclohydrolase [Thermoanaerobaculia bacterium]HUM30747.1 bifunctional phosphoribosylaminoimidazolecarboxamide formyltransferase/IMP cyclohydrolase [Thermoanaerobaculia bacterium]HXK68964.1 bifunctional phosphoribosylaminoimidazolecarboxamide formyltransferase/IMP cyclohydrolase [Thermoanaerobaculia bacterium]
MVIKIKRALISTYDKTGLTDVATFLAGKGVEIVSTGGTSAFLEKVGIRHKKVEELTGFPEILGGRVKTLHPIVHAGILADQNSEDHMEQLSKLGIEPFQLVIVNLYPFREVIRRGCTEDEAIENIDIGGPTMVRAAAKNHRSVCVVMDPADYHVLTKTIEEHGGIPAEFSRQMALRTFSRTAMYDATIVESFSRMWDGETFPEHIVCNLRRVGTLRYGENSHQESALYKLGNLEAGLTDLRKIQGKELSFNNILDMDSAWRCVSDFIQPAAVVVKHTNPCGMGRGETLLEAFERAWSTDPKSAFGGVIALNRSCTPELAEKICANFVEVVVAPDFSEPALEIFSKKKNLRLVAMPALTVMESFDLKRVWGGFLLQTWDQGDPNTTEWKVVTRRKPSAEEEEALAFNWKVIRHVKSNAIIFGTANQTVGIGAGQMSRVDAVELAVKKAELPLQGTVVASDAFFPFRDNVDAIAASGATGIIQPGGSIRDEEVIAAADEHNLTMIFTGVRHFKH